MSNPSLNPSLYERRPLGDSGVSVAPVALGCWPIAGVSSLNVNDEDSVATITAAIDAGINHLDTAYVYGPNGESDRLIARAIQGRRDEVVLASKGGVHYEGAEMQTDARPETLVRECEESLARLGTDRVELFYLHSPDPETPVERSAEGLAEIKRSGKALSIGVSNCSLDQTRAIHAVCPVAAVQLPYNLLQRDIEQETIPWCRENGVAVMVYWPLMKGLLAGKMTVDQVLDEEDSRRGYPMYQGEEWQRNHAFVDRLRGAAALTGCTVAQLVVNWTFNQPGVTATLCGAKRASQIGETAEALSFRLTDEQRQIIDAALAERGEAATKRQFT